MSFIRRLWHRLLFGSSPRIAQPRPAAASAAAAAATAARLARPMGRPFTAEELATLREEKVWPPRFVYRSREEVELALLMPWLPDADRRRFLDSLRPKAAQYQPWTDQCIEQELRQQLHQWDDPLVIPSPETITVEGLCGLLGAELATGLNTFCTPLDLLCRPVRMLWLLRQGQRAAQAYARLEQAVGSRAQALNFAWWVVAGL